MQGCQSTMACPLCFAHYGCACCRRQIPHSSSVGKSGAAVRTRSLQPCFSGILNVVSVLPLGSVLFAYHQALMFKVSTCCYFTQTDCTLVHMHVIAYLQCWEPSLHLYSGMWFSSDQCSSGFPVACNRLCLSILPCNLTASNHYHVTSL